MGNDHGSRIFFHFNSSLAGSGGGFEDFFKNFVKEKVHAQVLIFYRAAGSAAAFVLPFVEGTQQAAAATAGLEEYVGAGAATDLPAATFLDGVFTNAFGGHSDFGMETFCGASGVAATDLLGCDVF